MHTWIKSFMMAVDSLSSTHDKSSLRFVNMRLLGGIVIVPKAMPC